MTTPQPNIYSYNLGWMLPQFNNLVMNFRKGASLERLSEQIGIPVERVTQLLQIICLIEGATAEKAFAEHFPGKYTAAEVVQYEVDFLNEHRCGQFLTL